MKYNNTYNIFYKTLYDSWDNKFQGFTIGGAFLLARIAKFYKDHYLAAADELEITARIAKDESLKESDFKKANKTDLHIVFTTLFNYISPQKIEKFLAGEKFTATELDTLVNELPLKRRQNLKSYIHNYAIATGKIYNNRGGHDYI